MLNPAATSEPFLALIPGASGPWELIILALIVLLLFGSRLPGAAKSLGQSFSAFKKGLKDGQEEAESGGPGSIERES